MSVSIRRLCAAAAIGIGLLATPRLGAQEDDAQLTRTLRVCNLCHLQQFQTTHAGPHSVLDGSEWQARTGQALSCLNCHGEATEHIRGGGGRQAIFAFREEPALEQTTRCLGCHRDTHPGFDRSNHAQAGLTCSNCHRQHGDSAATMLLRDIETPLELTALRGSTRICFDCHGTQFSEFAFNERHRLREGILECTSCHDPHASSTRSLLGGFKQQQCVDCHVDKDGPFVFEHGASRVEGCTACHSPHGSPNRHMLAHQRVGELCFSCHAAVPQFHFGFSPVAPPRFGLDTQCTNCHSAIHGSNFDPFFLR
jgi:DmsE family decaheme c-type cytochrome